MKNLKTHAIVSIVLCVLVIIMGVFSFLALSDIYHGTEPDLTAEWWILRITFLFVGSLVLSTFFLTMRMIKKE